MLFWTEMKKDKELHTQPSLIVSTSAAMKGKPRIYCRMGAPLLLPIKKVASCLIPLHSLPGEFSWVLAGNVVIALQWTVLTGGIGTTPLLPRNAHSAFVRTQSASALQNSPPIEIKKASSLVRFFCACKKHSCLGEPIKLLRKCWQC